MGKKKYTEDIERLFGKSPVVNLKSIGNMMKSRKKVKQYQRHLARNLVLKGRINKLAKGCYTAYDDPSLSVFCFKPAYLGLQDALSFHNLWEQETVPVVITARKVRNGIRKSMGANVLMRRIDKRYMFGYDYYNIGKFYLPYSDIEKTFIDMVYFRERLGGEALESIKKRISRKKLNSYLKHYPEMTRKRVLNLLK